jgi:hypothetical protein
MPVDFSEFDGQIQPNIASFSAAIALMSLRHHQH